VTEIRVCESPDCTRSTPEPSLEYCSGHRGRLHRHGDLLIGVPFEYWPKRPSTPTQCVAAGCPGQALGGSLYCADHGDASVEAVCAVGGCDRDVYSSGICHKDYKRWIAGHNRSRYRTRDGRCEGRCGVCRWDHAREAREDRLAALEQGALHAGARREIVARVWGGDPLEKVADEAGVTVKQLWSTGAAWPEFVYALDAALMARRDPAITHGTTYSYRRHGCRCPECRAAKATHR